MNDSHATSQDASTLRRIELLIARVMRVTLTSAKRAEEALRLARQGHDGHHAPSARLAPATDQVLGALRRFADTTADEGTTDPSRAKLEALEAFAYLGRRLAGRHGLPWWMTPVGGAALARASGEDGHAAPLAWLVVRGDRATGWTTCENRDQVMLAEGDRLVPVGPHVGKAPASDNGGAPPRSTSSDLTENSGKAGNSDEKLERCAGGSRGAAAPEEAQGVDPGQPAQPAGLQGRVASRPGGLCANKSKAWAALERALGVGHAQGRREDGR